MTDPSEAERLKQLQKTVALEMAQAEAGEDLTNFREEIDQIQHALNRLGAAEAEQIHANNAVCRLRGVIASQVERRRKIPTYKTTT